MGISPSYVRYWQGSQHWSSNFSRFQAYHAPWQEIDPLSVRGSLGTIIEHSIISIVSTRKMEAGMSSLTEFISDVRNASNEDARLIMADELAAMRTKIREADPQVKSRIIAKLVFLNINGYNTSFAQLEAVNLMSQEAYGYKRLGYLGAGTLLDEQNDLLVLATHCVMKDLQDPRPLVQALALTLIANKGSAEMCRAVSTDVEKRMFSEHPGIMKRAAAAACTIIRKVPELAESYKKGIINLYGSTKHSVVGGAISLTMEVLKANPALRESFTMLAKPLTALLKALIERKPSMEFRFTIFNDPFLQIKVMKVLSMLQQPSTELDDVLTTIMTTTDTQRHAGRTLLLQAVETTCAVAQKPTLRSLAFNQVGRLFAFKDPGIVYSTLSVFGRVLYNGREIIDRTSSDSIALQRHKAQIVHCLDHRDASIRRRALDVILALVDETNAEGLIPEVIDYLQYADNDFRSEMVAKLYTAIQRFAPSKTWSFDMVLRLILDSGDYIGNDILTSFCKMIRTSPSVREHGLQKLANIIYGYQENQTLISITSWTLGEFQMTVIDDMIDTLHQILKMPNTKTETKCYITTALAKMGARWNCVANVLPILEELSHDTDIEVQQRSGELIGVLNNRALWDHLLQPADTDEDAAEEETKAQIVQSGGLTDDLLDIGYTPAPAQTQTRSAGADLLDLIESEVLAPSAKPEEKQSSLPEISPPKGAVEALRTNEFVMYFEIQKNQANPNQMAIRSSIYNLGMTPLNNFSIQYGVPNGWMVRSQPASGNVLEARGGKPIQQVLMLENKGMNPLSMKTQTSYMFGCQPLKSIETVKPIFD